MRIDRFWAKACAQSRGRETPASASPSTRLYPEWQPGREHDDVGQVDRRRGELRRQDARRKSAARALLALKWPARNIMSWRLSSIFERSALAVHDAGSSGATTVGRDERIDGLRRCPPPARCGPRSRRPRGSRSRSPARSRCHDPISGGVRVEHARRSRSASRPGDRRRGRAPGRCWCGCRPRRPSRTRPGSGRSHGGGRPQRWSCC